MKAYTDLKQSKKLAEILPLESADMHYNNISIKGINYVDAHRAELMEYNRAIEVLSKYIINPLFEVIPCWSLTALLGLIPNSINFGYENDSIFVLRKIENGNYIADYYEVSFVKDNPIDAVFEMILKLHKLNLL